MRIGHAIARSSEIIRDGRCAVREYERAATRAEYGTRSLTVLRWLEEGPKSTSWLVHEGGVNQNALGGSLGGLLKAGYITMRNSGGHRHYSITHKGRDRIGAFRRALGLE